MSTFFPTLRLRSKLLLITLSLLAIPWVGYEYVREMERFLRTGMENTLQDQARAIATVLHDRRELFKQSGNIVRNLSTEKTLYARKLDKPVQLDGYIDDWDDIIAHAKRYAGDHVMQSHNAYNEDSLQFRHIMGIYGRYLYVLFIVQDDSVVYRPTNSLRLDRSDHLQIAMQSNDGPLTRYLVTTRSPGWVNAFQLEADPQSYKPVKPEVRIKGEWQETANGYVIEMRIPRSILGDRLTFAIADVDDIQTRTIDTMIGTAGITRIEDLGTVLTPSTEIEAILKGLDRGDSRIWILNTSGHVLALAGSLFEQGQTPQYDQPAEEPATLASRLLNRFYSLILPKPADSFTDDLSGASRLDGAEIQSAINGKADVRWRKTPDEQVSVLSAAQPVWNDGNVVGAVVVEQTSNRLVSLQNRATISLLNMTVLVFIAATLFLVIFATRLSNRIRRLHSEAEGAIAKDGRIQSSITASNDKDEIGDLSRSFAEVMGRLEGYTRYLESMSSKLSHEIRTPLAVVKSSLENLETFDLPEASQAYTQRAREGIERLNRIITNMNEATRLEQALQTTDRESFAVNSLVTSCIEGYRLAYSEQQFELTITGDDAHILGNPDLFAQMLDKLIDNAVDFAKASTPVVVSIVSEDDIVVQISNTGPLLPDDMQSNLFDSMVSMRENSGEDAHLGLGLYIVRLITDYHHGTVSAANRETADGVVFTIRLPRG